MRISNIDQYLGGANNVKAISMIRGEQRNFTGTVQDENDAAIDIADYTISAVAEYYKADVTIRGTTVTITDFTSFAKADKTLTVTKASDTATGMFTVTLDSDMAADSDTADLDAQTQVLVPVIYITYDDGGDPKTIRKSRMIAIIRHSG